ncbi:MAG: 2-oxoacid:acceptor oxidoreductase family protein [Thermodesulfovibrionales bacterium]
MEERIIIAGSGGQGVLFLGKLIAYAGMVDGKEVTWFPSYGAEMRGGTANCTVVISPEMIGSPVVRNPHILIAMNEASFQRFAGRLLPGGTLLYDSSFMNLPVPMTEIKASGVPASDVAASLRNTKAANMVLLGALIALTRTFSREAAIRTLEEMTPSHRRDALETNTELMRRGYHFIEDQKN